MIFLEILILILSFFIGIFTGILTGLFPGIHINLVFSLILTFSLVNFFDPFVLVVFIVSLTISHCFFDFIPSIFLGIPSEDSALSVLPGHKLVLEGKGKLAVYFCFYGCLIGILILVFIFPFFILFLSKFYNKISNIMGLILIIFSGYLVLNERNKFFGLFIFLLSGILGIGVLNLNLKEPLLPLFTGLFGASSILISIRENTKIPKQEDIKIKEINFEKKSFFDSIFVLILSSPLVSFLPGLGSSQAATIATELKGKTNEKDFLFILGAINILVISLSFVSYYSIKKTRTGAAVALSKIIPNINFYEILLILVIIVFASLVSFFIGIKITNFFCDLILKFNYRKISIFILLLVSFIVFIISGFLGFFVFIVSSFLGISAILLNVKRSQLMGCILVPTIFYYLL